MPVEANLQPMILPEWQEEVSRILAVRLDNIGDVILLGPALRSLRHAFPHAEITLLASPAGSQAAPLLPWVDDVITLRPVWQDISGALPQDPARELRLVEELRSRDFDAAFIFTSFSQSPYPPAYMCYLAGIPVRVGHSKEFGGGVLSHSYKPPMDEGHQAERNLALLERFGLPAASNRRLELQVPEEAQQRADTLLAGCEIDRGAPFVLFAPGASCAARRYDPARSAAMIRILADQSGLPVVIVGSQREAETLQPVIQAAGDLPGILHSLVGQTSVPELAGLIRRAALVIANNSASLHMADAFSRPMLILYSGSETESQWMPRNAPARLLRHHTECAPCYRFQCPYAMECLDFTPREVAQAGLHLLAALHLWESPRLEIPAQPVIASKEWRSS